MAEPDFSTYEGRQQFRDSHPGWIVDAAGAYNPYSGSEVNKSGAEVRNTGAEPQYGPAPIGNTQAFTDLTPITGEAKAMNERLHTVEQQVQTAANANLIPSGPGGSFLKGIIAGVLQATQKTAIERAKASGLAQFNPQGSTAALRAAGFDDTPEGRAGYALAQSLSGLGPTPVSLMQQIASPIEQAYQQRDLLQRQAAGRQQVINNATSYGQNGFRQVPLAGTSQPFQPLTNGQFSNFGGQQFTLPVQQQQDPLSLLLLALLAPMLGGGGGNTAPGPASVAPEQPVSPTNGSTDLSTLDPYKQAAMAAGNQVNATPAAMQQFQNYNFQPLTSQQPRTIPSNLFNVPSTQLLNNFTPSERTGLFLLGNGLGIQNEDLLNNIFSLAPPAGSSAQSYLAR